MKKSKKNKPTKKTTKQGERKIQNLSNEDIDKMVFDSPEWEMANKVAITNILKEEFNKAGIIFDNNFIDQQVKAYTAVIRNKGYQEKISKISSLVDKKSEIEKKYKEMSKQVFEEFGIKVDDSFLNKSKNKP